MLESQQSQASDPTAALPPTLASDNHGRGFERTRYMVPLFATVPIPSSVHGRGGVPLPYPTFAPAASAFRASLRSTSGCRARSIAVSIRAASARTASGRGPTLARLRGARPLWQTALMTDVKPAAASAATPIRNTPC